MTTGKPTKFHCIWCEKDVDGHLIEIHIDYIKKTTDKQFACPQCPHRITREKTEGCE